MSNSVFALVDCNNFFCSCERVFQPGLRNKPVVVLSNNDGCIIARSQEVKDMNIPMAAPYFKYKTILQQRGVKVFSSNYQLYGDMSNRIMSLLAKFSPEIEFYSIDEAFLKLNNIADIDYEKYALTICQTIKKATDIPVSIGIGSTKTMAKIANNIAKKSRSGVFVMLNSKLSDEVLKQTAIEDVWGIGSKMSLRLKLSAINTAYDLKKTDTMWARKYYKVTGEKIVRELNDISCLDLAEFKPKKNIITSRSFGHLVSDKETLKQILANYAVRACQKLRQQQSKAQGLGIFICTSRFKSSKQQYYKSLVKGFDIATNDTSKIIRTATQALEQIFKPGYGYHKCGIILLDLINQDCLQPNLFISDNNSHKKDQLMQLIDGVNKISGKETLFFAAQGTKRSWSLKSQHCSPKYTTSWDEILCVS